MLVNIDLEGVLEQAEALPETTATLDGIAPRAALALCRTRWQVPS
jgi:hypothetical protein